MENLEVLKLLTLAAICYVKDMEIIKSKMIGNKEILDLYTHLPTVQGTHNSIILSALADSNIDVNKIKRIEDIKEILKEVTE